MLLINVINFKLLLINVVYFFETPGICLANRFFIGSIVDGSEGWTVTSNHCILIEIRKQD